MKSGFCIISILMLGMLFPGSVTGQSFLQGYIIKTKGDTLKGLIRTKGLSNSRQVIGFKENTDDKSMVEYTPGSIESFFVSSSQEHYFSKELLVDVKPFDDSQIDIDNPAPKLETRTVFLRLLVRGKASLYSFVEPSREHYFLQMGDGPITELLMVKFYSSAAGHVVEIETYKMQAKQILSCDGLVVKVAFNASSLKKAVAAYNTCSGGTSEIPGNEEKRKARLEVIGGFAMMSYTYNELTPQPSNAPISFVDFDNSTSVNVGFRVESDARKNLTGGGELLIQYHAFTANHAGQLPPPIQWASDLTCQMNYLFINVGGYVTIHFGERIRPFLRLGPSLNLSIQTENYVKYARSDGSADLGHDGKASDNSSPTGFGFLLGPGVQLGRATLEFRYAKSRAGAPNNIFGTSSVGAIVGFRLSK